MAALVHDRPGDAATRPAPVRRRDAERRRACAPLRPVTEGEVGDGRAQAVVAAVVIVALLALGGSLADAAGRMSITGVALTDRPGPAGPPAIADVALADAVLRSSEAVAPGAAGGGVHVVQPGQTYWSIAQELGGSGDIRARVAALEAANDGRPLQAGDRLALPDPE